MTTTEQSAQALECPHCAGSGERQYMTQHLGPNDYEVTALCHDCNGSGEFKEPSTQAEWDRVYALVRHWSGRAIRAETELAHQPAAAQLAGWISVEDLLPEPWTDVLIYPRPTDYCCEGQIDRKGQWTYSEYSQWGDEKHKINPTHWCPHLPPPTQPKEPSNG